MKRFFLSLLAAISLSDLGAQPTPAQPREATVAEVTSGSPNNGGLYISPRRFSGSGSILPSQAGADGKFLTSNGTTASWGTLNLSAYLPLAGGTMTGPILNSVGTAALPGMAFAGEADTGFFLSAANAIGVSTAGVERWTFNASGAFNPLVNNTYDIGNGSVNPRDIYVARLLTLSSTLGTSAGGILLRDVNIYSYGGATMAIDFSGSISLALRDTGTTYGIFTRNGDIFNVSAPRSSLVLKASDITALTLSGSDQSAKLAGALITDSSTRSGPGAIPITTSFCKVTSTGVADALTLANGVDGQRISIVHDVDGGSFVLTPATKTGWSTFTSTAVGETITLVYATTRGWYVTGSYLGAIAP